MSVFNERLNYLKKSLGINATEMAKRIGIPNSTLAYYLKDREPRYDVLIKIAKEFNVSVNWLIGFYDNDKEELIKENEMLRNKLKEISNLSRDIVI